MFPSRATGTGTTFIPDYGFYGGEMEITAECNAPGYRSATVRHTATVHGTQPTNAGIIAQIGTVESPFDGADLRRIACHESSLTQFDPSPGPPLTSSGPSGKGGDIGIKSAPVGGRKTCGTGGPT